MSNSSMVSRAATTMCVKQFKLHLYDTRWAFIQLIVVFAHFPHPCVILYHEIALVGIKKE